MHPYANPATSRRGRRSLLSWSWRALAPALVLAVVGAAAPVAGAPGAPVVAAPQPAEPVKPESTQPAGPSAAEQKASDRARATGQKVQVEALTTETTMVWALPDGGFQADLSDGVARFRRGGSWVDVDLTLVRRADGAIEPKAHPKGLVLSGRRPAAGDLASIAVTGGRVGLGWAEALPEPVLDGTRATYPGVLPDIDLVVEANPDGFEQFFIVRTPAAVQRAEELRLSLIGDALAAAVAEPTGATSLRGPNGAEIARIPVPEMWDSGPRDVTGEPRRAVVRANLRKPAAKSAAAAPAAVAEMVITPDVAWLKAPERVFPLVIDPTVVAPSVGFDTYVIDGDTTANNAATDIWWGRYSTTKVARGYVHWNTSVLAGKQITAASAKFWAYWANGCTGTAGVEWEVWTTGPASAATVAGNEPAWLAGPHATSAQSVGGAACADNWISIDGKGFFQYAADRSQSVAPMGLKAKYEGAADPLATMGFKQVRTVEGGAGIHMPIASVTYNHYPAVTARATVPATTCTTGGGRPAITTMTPTLQATVSDGDATATSVKFEWWNVGGSAAIGSATNAAVASGGTTSTVIPAGQLGEGGSYQWRVVVSDGAGSTTSSWCEFSTYVTVPPVSGCSGGVANDFNGDGVRDTALADPGAAVSGFGAAGVVHIINGASGAVTTLRQGASGVPDTPEANDTFGRAVAAYDANRDGCTDLAVGAPFEDNGTTADTGAVYLLYGSPGGLAAGPASVVIQQGANLGLQGTVPGAPEAADWFGYSLAGGQTSSGEGYLVIGVPGEDAAAVDSGGAHYLRGVVNIAFDQDTANVPGEAEIDDRYGYAVTASPYHVAVSAPGENMGHGPFEGLVNVFGHTVTSGLPTFVAAVHQDSTGVSDLSQPDDQFGRSLSMVAYRRVGQPAGVADSLLVVGVPGEDLGGVVDAGLVQQFLISAGGVTELASISQTTAGIGSSDEAGDYFGARVVAVNTNPAAEASATTVLVAVGTPGKDVTGTRDAGVVRVFAGGTTTIPVAANILRGSGLSGAPGEGELVGGWLSGSSQHLYLASPYQNRGVSLFAWSTLATGGTTPSATFVPGQGGLPSSAAAFGLAVAG
jgi:hypothetical protein